MTTTYTKQTVVVELVSFGQAKEYRNVSLAEAKEILKRKMQRGWQWHVPTWQFDDESAPSGLVLQEWQRAAYEAIEAS